MTAQHIIQAGSITPSLAVSLEEIKDMAGIQFCTGNHESVGKTLLQFLQPCFMYTLTKKLLHLCETQGSRQSNIKMLYGIYTGYFLIFEGAQIMFL